VPVIDRLDDSIEGLQIDRRSYLTFMADVRARIFGDCETTQKAAETLGCDRLLIPSLLKMGALRGTCGRSGSWVERKSLRDFQSTYLFLATVARALRTNTERLVRLCHATQMSVWCPRCGNRTRVPFIRVTDADRLRNTLSKVRRGNGPESQKTLTHWRPNESPIANPGPDRHA